MSDNVPNQGEPVSRSSVLVPALGGVATLVLIALVLFRVLGGVNQGLNKAAEEQRERDEQVRRQIARIGGGKPIVLDATKDRAFQDLEHTDPVIRLESVDVISKLYLSTPQAVPVLLKRLNSDPDPRVRLAALRALKKIDPRPPAIAETLKERLDDEDPRVRAEAAKGD